jgi:hypothetical protein
MLEIAVFCSLKLYKGSARWMRRGEEGSKLGRGKRRVGGSGIDLDPAWRAMMGVLGF